MTYGKTMLSMLALVLAPSIALAQNTNKALEQLKDVNRSSQDAAGTKNPEASKAKSNKNIDTATPPAVRAGPPSTQTKAERDAAAIKAYTSQPPTGQAEISKIRKKKIEVPSPGASAPAKTAASPAPVKPVTTNVAAPAKVVAPVKPAAAAVAAPAAVAPAKPAAVAAPAKPTPAPIIATTPVRPSTSTYSTASSPSTSSPSSSSKKK